MVLPKPILMTTRYNSETWLQYMNWRKKYNLKNSYYYSCPFPISNTICIDSTLYILEMHNSLNKIMGMGVVILQEQNMKKYKIYDNDCFNRYHYHSTLYITRDMLSKDSLLLENGIWISILEILELVCFKGKRHSKRHMNIAKVPTIYFQGSIMNKVMECLKQIVKKKEYEKIK
ncbi:MAG: hypothetical protein CBC91_00640 [Rickettsiales bacterium TMED131]|nr:MAG: hypothetical protein CBC91_00640 [Rickettsiales bacterium TMED131]|tara:strand:- start:5411 stop:5932 length:522 start_codon:yes stop_codon:yes gene_type:complete